MINFTKLGNPILRECCQPVRIINKDVLKVADKLRFSMLTAQAHGVAANQIGSNKAMFVYTWESNVNKVLVDPHIINQSDLDVEHEEGCLSIPGYRFKVPRSDWVQIEALNLNGDTIVIDASGMLAYIFQHEIDHLSGKLIVDYLNETDSEAFLEQWKKRKK